MRKYIAGASLSVQHSILQAKLKAIWNNLKKGKFHDTRKEWELNRVMANYRDTSELDADEEKRSGENLGKGSDV